MGKAKKKAAGGKKPDVADGEEDDWEALLEAEAGKNAPPAPAPAADAQSQPGAVGQADDDNNRGGGDPPDSAIAPPNGGGAQDAAAAFLASQGIVSGDGDNKADAAKKKKKKKKPAGAAAAAAPEEKKNEKVCLFRSSLLHRVCLCVVCAVRLNDSGWIRCRRRRCLICSYSKPFAKLVSVSLFVPISN
jgi:hypothetical protein